MQIIIDTREQLPLSFDNEMELELIEGTVVEKLSVGDYGCRFKDGHQPPWYFERKSIGDLYGTLSKGYKRFKREMDRAKDAGQFLVICVEGTFSEVVEGYSYSTRQPESIVLQLATLCIRYGVMTWFCRDRSEMCSRIVYHYLSYGRDYLRRNGK